MDIVTLDFETFYSDDYTLKKLSTEAYVRDPRFEALMCAIQWPGQATVWYPREDLKHVFASVDWSKVAVLCHHAQFDGLIMAHHYGAHPGLWLDTLSMGRQVHGNHLSLALGSLAEHYELEAKNVPYNLFKGKHWDELDASTRREVGRGCIHDVELNRGIFDKMAPLFPAEEYGVVDATIRMFTEPLLQADSALLGEVWHYEQARKRQMMLDLMQLDGSACNTEDALKVFQKQLQSADMFAELLRKVGVEPALKESKTVPGKMNYAFAKTDDFMRELQDGVNEDAAALVRARLGVKSTIDQDRAEFIGNMAMRGDLCIYLRYCGAHTTRWSGGDGGNFQNSKRGSKIRRSIKAPPGCKLLLVDASQIEARLLDTFAGQWDSVEAWRANVDQYSKLATEFYGYVVTKETHPKERGTGKQLKLSCGYGAGDETIMNTAKLGTYGPPVYMTLEEARAAKVLYRGRHPMVTQLWKQAENMLSTIASGGELQWQCVTIKNKRIYLPNGGWLNYDSLEWAPERTDEETGEVWQAGWRVKTRKGWQKMYGAKLIENLIQALARVVVSQILLKMRAQGMKIVMCTHDDLVAVVKDDVYAAQWLQWVESLFRAPPPWMPQVPLEVEGDLADCYEK